MKNGKENGGARRSRTADLLNAIQALSQLSYGPIHVRRGCRLPLAHPCEQAVRRDAP